MCLEEDDFLTTLWTSEERRIEPAPKCVSDDHHNCFSMSPKSPYDAWPFHTFRDAEALKQQLHRKCFEANTCTPLLGRLVNPEITKASCYDKDLGVKAANPVPFTPVVHTLRYYRLQPSQLGKVLLPVARIRQRQYIHEIRHEYYVKTDGSLLDLPNLRIPVALHLRNTKALIAT